VQGHLVAVVSSLDLLAILSGHPKMNGLRTAAITTFHQAETGAPAGIARIVQAATAPNEGQRFLQGEFHVGAMQGESREQTSTGTDAAGNVFTARLAERSVVLDDGRSVHVQQSQQVVAPMCDNNMLLAAIKEGQTDVQEMKKSFMNKLEKGLAKESEAREQAFSKLKEASELDLAKWREERELDLAKWSEARELDLAKASEAREEGLTKEREAREQAILVLEAKNSAMEKRMSDMEQDKATSNKRPRHAAQKAPSKTKNITSNKSKTSFAWMKMVKGVPNGCRGFATAEEATLDMLRFYAAALGSSAEGGSSGGATRGSSRA